MDARQTIKGLIIVGLLAGCVPLSPTVDPLPPEQTGADCGTPDAPYGSSGCPTPTTEGTVVCLALECTDGRRADGLS